MKSYEKGQDGGPLTIEEDMYNFCLHNVGGVNSGWHHEIDDSGVSTYYYINVEGVVSDTLEIRRYNNIVQAEIPNLYGIGINLDLNNGLLKLLGRDSVVLSEEALPLGATMSSIEHNDELGTVTFKFTNLDDIVLDLKEIISLSNYYTKQEIDEMFKVKTSVIEDTSVEFTILNNSDTSFTSLESAVFTIPSDVEHGYSAAVSIRFNVSRPNVRIINNSEFNLRYVYNGAFIPEPFWNGAYQYELLILCDGIEIRAYIQELES